MRQDRRSPEAAAVRPFYKTQRWRDTREWQLTKEPLCQWCKAKGRLVVATVCHHVDKGSKQRDFFAGPFQSLCKPCHDGEAQQIERIGFSKAIGADGWPTDERHPALRTRAF